MPAGTCVPADLRFRSVVLAALIVVGARRLVLGRGLHAVADGRRRRVLRYFLRVLAIVDPGGPLVRRCHDCVLRDEGWSGARATSRRGRGPTRAARWPRRP